MRPALSFPLDDLDGTIFPHLQAILPDLKTHFEHAYISLSSTAAPPHAHFSPLQADDFFTVFSVEPQRQVGDLFAYLYRQTAETAPPDQIIHLCYLDRLSFALEGGYKDVFLQDIDSLSGEEAPLIFQRSPVAWETHPRNYREIEGMVTTVGRHLFGREFDYAWCHLALTAGQLREIMPHVKNPDLSMVAEMIFYLQLQGHIQTREVDWLAWEDPFLLHRDPDLLKQARENSLAETYKRLRYALPMMQTLTRLSQTYPQIQKA